MLVTLVHVFYGGYRVMDPVRASDLTPLIIAVTNVIWHVATLLMALLALATLWLARHPNRPLAVLIIAIHLGAALLFLGYGAVDLGSLRPMPHWVAFLILPTLMLIGERNRT
ncbi:hypothetical protein AB3Y40_18980 [Yoonia sp. R2331]|uniref:hypothetical protein n=1 Tax=Yoonia sp. R2331 TaxID=3237238 RepID=UPI0034E5BE63